MAVARRALVRVGASVAEPAFQHAAVRGPARLFLVLPVWAFQLSADRKSVV